jgi:hypothetical protein
VWSAGRGGYVFAIQWKLTGSCKQWCTQRKHPDSVVFDRATKKERCSNLTNPQKQQQENQTFKLLHALRVLSYGFSQEDSRKETRKTQVTRLNINCKPSLQTNTPVQSDRSLSKQIHNQAKNPCHW